MMNLPGKLTIGLLQEDNPIKFFFRIRPMFVREENNFVPVENVFEAFPEDGYIRIVPDKNEISHFKNRMLKLGRYCILDLRKYANENEKIRTNKNYQPGGNERNANIVYSDVIAKVTSATALEVVDASGMFASDTMMLRAPQPGTHFVLAKQEDKLTGPWTWSPEADAEGCIVLKKAANMEHITLSAEELSDSLLVMDEITLCVAPAKFGIAENFVEPEPEAARPVRPAPVHEAPVAARPAPIRPAPVAAPVAAPVPAPAPAVVEEAAPAEAEPAVTVEKAEEPAAETAAAPNAAVQAAPESVKAEESAPAKETKPIMPWLNRTDFPKIPRAVAARLTPKEQALQAQVGINPRRGRSLSEVVDEKWRQSRIDQLGHPVPAEATSRPVLSPIERAVDAVKDAWSVSEARTGLLSGLLGIVQLKDSISECLGLAKPEGETQKPTDRLMTQLEAEKLRIMGEIDALKQKRLETTAALMEELRSTNRQEINAFEARNKALKDEIEKNEKLARQAQERTKIAESALKQANAELEKRLLDSAVSERAMSIIRGGTAVKSTHADHPDLYDPNAGQLISDLRVQMENAGFELSNAEMVNLLIAMYVGGLLILSGEPGTGKSELARRLVASFGLSGENGRFVELKTMDDPAFDNLVDNADRLTPVIALYDDVNIEPSDSELNRLLRKWERARRNGVPVCLIFTAQDAPVGYPLSARLLSRAFFVRLQRTASDAPWRPMKVVLPAPDKAVAMTAFDRIMEPAQDMETSIDLRLTTLREALTKLNWTLDRGTLNQLWQYCAIGTGLMREDPMVTLDFALSQRALPEMLAAMDVDALHELPNLFCDMPRCIALMEQPLPLPPL